MKVPVPFSMAYLKACQQLKIGIACSCPTELYKTLTERVSCYAKYTEKPNQTPIEL